MTLGVLLSLLATNEEGTQEPSEFIAYPGGPVVPHQLVVKFRSEVPESQRHALLSAYDVTVTDAPVDDFLVLDLPETERAKLGEALAASGALEVVEEVLLRVPAAVPNDPAYASQWHLEHIGMEQAWEITDGSGVRVAILDTGVAFENFTDGGVAYGKAPDLGSGGFVAPWDASGPAAEEDSHPNDDYGHGTHVAGTISQTTDNGIGAAGIAPGVSIVPVKVCGPTGLLPTAPAYGCSSTDIAEGITWAVNHGAHVINMSLTGTGAACTQSSAEEDAALQYAADAGVVVVGAAGNQGNPQLCFPASDPAVVSVGAVNRSFNLSSYSNHGTNSEGGLMDVVAPGGDVGPDDGGDGSLVWQQTYLTCTAAVDYTTFAVTPCAGTSMAAAHVSGVVALIRSYYPQLNATQVRETLRECALDIGPDGTDPQYGHGLVRADEALVDTDSDKVPDCIDPGVMTPSPTPVPPPNDCLAPSVTPTLVPSASPTPTPTASPTPSASPSPASSPTPSATATPAPSPSPTPSPSATATGEPTPTAPPTVSPTPTGTPSPTPIPTPTPTPSPTPSPAPIACGDVNCSGEIDGSDSLGIMRWAAQASPFAPCLGKGFVTCDADLDAVDAMVILRYTADLEPSLPAGCSG